MENPDATEEELCATISTLPSQLSADDMDDFFSLAQYYASRTPQSFRKVWHTMHAVVSCTCTSLLCTHLQDYHSLLFGSGRSLASLSTHVSHALCLPVSLSEVLEVNQMEGENEVCPPTLTHHLASWSVHPPSHTILPAGGLSQRPLTLHMHTCSYSLK